MRASRSSPPSARNRSSASVYASAWRRVGRERGGEPVELRARARPRRCGGPRYARSVSPGRASVSWGRKPTVSDAGARSTAPESSATWPASARSSVVLPMPFGPTMPSRSPAATDTDTSFSTRRPPSETVTPRADNMPVTLGPSAAMSIAGGSFGDGTVWPGACGDVRSAATGATAGSSAQSRTWVTSSARWKVICSRTDSGTSSRSGPLRFGSTTVVRPARCAASTFCLSPPIGSTRPCSVTSPVMPTSARTGRPVSRDTSAVVIVTPADGPSFGHRARRHVHVEAPLVQRVRVDAERIGVRPDVAHRDLRRLLHDVAELTGQGQAGLAGQAGRLHEEHVATGAGDRETRSPLPPRTCARALPRRRTAGARAASGRRPAPIATGGVAVATRDLGRRLAQQLAELTLEVPHARFPGVVGDDGAQRVVVHRDLVLAEPVALALAGQQVVPGDDDLLVLGVAVEPHDLEAVEQRAGDRLQDVRGRQEQHARRGPGPRPGSGRGTCGSAPGRAPRATRSTGRPASPRRACRPRPAG